MEKPRITVFKKEGRILYFIRQDQLGTHYVPTVHWREYCAFRLEVPKLCRMFNTIQETFKNVQT